MEAKTNEETADPARFRRFYESTDLVEIREMMDIEHTLDSVAAEAIINQSDGYWPGGVNFIFYEHPRLGYQLYPWDLDNAWDRWPTNVAPDRRGGTFYPTRTLDTLWEDPGLMQFYVDSVARRLNRVDADVLVDRVDRWAEQIRPHVEEDPNRHYTMEEHDTAVDDLRDAARSRIEFLEGWTESRQSPDAF